MSTASERITEWQWPNLAQAGREMLDCETQYVREHPATAVLSTFAVGFVCGAAIVAISTMCQSAAPVSRSRNWQQTFSDAIPRTWSKELSRRFS